MTLPMPSAAALNALPYTEALEQALGQVIANARRDCEARLATADALLATAQARLAETEARCAALLAETDRKVDAKLATLRDGVDCDMGAVMLHVAETLAAVPAPQDGKDADPEILDALRCDIEMLRESVGAIPPPPDTSGFATKDDIAEVRAAIPAPVDTSGLATKDEVAQVREAIPDTSGFALKADIDALPAPKDYDGAIAAIGSEVKAATDAVSGIVIPDVSGFATRAEVDELRSSIPEPVDTSGFALKADLPAPLDMEAVAVIVSEKVEKAVAALPPAKDGEDADHDAIVRDVLALMPNCEELRGPAGVLPIVKVWSDGVHYAGEAVTHNGATFQALRDTGREPPHDDWICIASRGAPGDGFSVCSTWDEGAEYRRNDVVMKDGSSWVALRDDPGACPGDGWQLWASRGGKGKPGDVPSVEEIAAALVAQHGEHLRGLPGATIAALYVNEEGVLTVTMADGSEHTADFYPVLSRIAK